MDAPAIITTLRVYMCCGESLYERAASLSFLPVSSLAEFRGLFCEERRFFWSLEGFKVFFASLYRKSVVCVFIVCAYWW